MKKLFITVLIGFVFLSACKNQKETAEQNTKMVEEKAEEKPMTLEEEMGQIDSPEETEEGQILVKNATAHLSDSLVARIQRTACFGRCPIYTASIYESGRVVYQGEKWVEKEGNFEAEISQDKLDKLFMKADEIQFMELNSIYDSKSVTDLPSCIISLRIDDKVKIVVNRYQGPQKLAQFSQYFDQLINSLEYKPMSASE